MWSLGCCWWRKVDISACGTTLILWTRFPSKCSADLGPFDRNYDSNDQYDENNGENDQSNIGTRKT